MELNYKPPSLDSALDKIKKETVGNMIFDEKFLEKIICWHIICKIKKMLVIILVDEMRGQRRYRSAWASLVAQMVKNLPAIQETQIRSLGQEDPLKKKMATHSSIRKSHGEQSLTGYSPLGCQELDMTERLTLSLSEQRAGWKRVESVPGRAKGSYPAHSTRKIL